MKITAAASYAIAAMAYIVNLPDGQLVRCADVSRDLKFSEPYLLHSLTDLAKAGLLISVRGYLGGYKLGRPAKKITLLEIVQAVDGPVMYGFGGHLALAPNANATVRGAFEKLEADARKRLIAITLADLREAKAA